jgi:hypothetical protein
MAQIARGTYGHPRRWRSIPASQALVPGHRRGARQLFRPARSLCQVLAVMAAAMIATTAATTTRARTAWRAQRGHPCPVSRFDERDTKCAGLAGGSSRTSSTGSSVGGGCHRRFSACHHPAGGRPRCQRLLASIHQLTPESSITGYPNCCDPPRAVRGAARGGRNGTLPPRPARPLGANGRMDPVVAAAGRLWRPRR